MIPEQCGGELHGVVDDREARISFNEGCVRRIDPCKIQLTRRERREFCRRLVHHDDHEPLDPRPTQRFREPLGPAKDPTLVRTVLDEFEQSP